MPPPVIVILKIPPRKWRQNNILIVHDMGIGDFIVVSGAIREIRRLYPNDYITLLIKPNMLNLAELCPYVDEVLVYGGFVFYLPQYIEIIARLLERHFDICFNFGHTQETIFLSYMCGANLRITHNRINCDITKNYAPMLPGGTTQIIAENLSNIVVPRFKFGSHVADTAFALVDNIVHSPCKNRELEIWYSPFEFAQAKEILKNAPGKIYALCMGGSGLKKHYPPEFYAKVAEMILNEYPNATFVILGGGQNDLISAEIFIKNLNTQYHKNILNLVNKLNFRQSGAVLKLCNMYIGNDTSTVHTAAAVKCPVLTPNCFPLDISGAYADDIPRIYRPYRVPSVVIQPKHALAGCSDDKKRNQYGCISDKPHCITQIKPETMFEGFKILQQRIAEKNIEPLFIS